MGEDARRVTLRLVVTVLVVAAAFLGFAGRALAGEWIVQVDQAANGQVSADVQLPSVTQKSVNLTGVAALPFGVVTWSHSSHTCSYSPANCVDIPDAELTHQPFIAEAVPSQRVFLTAQPDPGYFFQGWTVTNGDPSLNPCDNSPVCEIPFQQRADVTPIFATCPAGQSCLTVVALPAGAGSFTVHMGSSAGGTPVDRDELHRESLHLRREPRRRLHDRPDRSKRRRRDRVERLHDERRRLVHGHGRGGHDSDDDVLRQDHRHEERRRRGVEEHRARALRQPGELWSRTSH